jgi:hypothetical protein
MKIGIALFITVITMQYCAAQINYKLVIKDFKKLEGSWDGSLTYLDYSTGKPFTMEANVEIKRLHKTNNFIFTNIYPKEASANSSDTIAISTDGKYIDDELIKSRTKLDKGIVIIISEQIGNDGNDNKPALFKHTYTFQKKKFSIKKEVQFVGTMDWVKRHEYTYIRK